MGLAVLVLISLLWGSSFVAIKVAAGSFGALDIASGRLAIAALCLGGAAVLTRARVPADPGVWARLLALSLVGQMAPFFLLGVSGQLTASSSSAMMMAAVPLLTFLAGRLFRDGDPWTPRAWLGLGIGFLGVLMALGWPRPGDAGAASDWLGKGAAILAAGGYALGTLISRSLAGRVGLTATVATTMTLSALLMGGVWLALHGGDLLAGGLAPAESWPDPTATLALVLLGLVNTAGVYFVYFWLIRREGPTFASLNNYLVPIFGVILGAVILGEPVQAQALAGLALVLLGIAVVRVGAGTGQRDKRGMERTPRCPHDYG